MTWVECCYFYAVYTLHRVFGKVRSEKSPSLYVYICAFCSLRACIYLSAHVVPNRRRHRRREGNKILNECLSIPQLRDSLCVCVVYMKKAATKRCACVGINAERLYIPLLVMLLSFTIIVRIINYVAAIFYKYFFTLFINSFFSSLDQKKMWNRKAILSTDRRCPS